MGRLRVVFVVLIAVGCALAQRWVTPAGGCTTADNTVLSGDVGPADTSGWQARAPMPTAPSGKYVKDGGWLAYDDSMKLVYGAKGNRRGDFYAYFPSASSDSWSQRALIPPGAEGKLPAKGAAGFSDGNAVLYATKGNNTLGFWKYDCVGDSWQQKTDVPLGPSGKKVKGGTDLVVASSGGANYVYLLKGYRNEFYKYDPATSTWTQLPNAPSPYVKWDNGSWLAYDQQNTIFAHQARYHRFYSFNTLTDQWDTNQLSPMPIAGSGGSKKSKDGGCATYHDSAIYALKGGNTQEFWKYNIAADTWFEKEMIPRGAPKMKKVKSGADITTMPPASDRPGQPAELPALTGNNTGNFWTYTTPGGAGPPMDCASNRDGVGAAERRRDEPFLTLAPNPLSGRFVSLQYSVTGPGPATARVYDVTGRSVLSASLITERAGTAMLDCHGLEAGVYLLKVEGAGFAAVRKLVVQR